MYRPTISFAFRCRRWSHLSSKLSLAQNFPRRLGIVFCACLFFCTQAPAAEYLINCWDSEKGLPDDFVTSIVQTKDGYIWIGTYNGLARFDGTKFSIFKPRDTPQLGHARIVKLFVDAEGALWINTYDGSLTSWHNNVFIREWNGAKKGISEAWLVASNSRE